MARSGIDALLHQPSLTHGSFQFRVIGGAGILCVTLLGQSRQVTLIKPFLDQIYRLQSHLVSLNSLGQHKDLAATLSRLVFA